MAIGWIGGEPFSYPDHLEVELAEALAEFKVALARCEESLDKRAEEIDEAA